MARLLVKAPFAPTEIVIRRVRPSDIDGLSAFYAGLSQESLHARFLGYARGVSGATARSFGALDHMHDEGFVALASEEGQDRLMGHVCLVQSGPRKLELGIAVADQYQHIDVGRRLFEAAVAWARERRFESIFATCYADNSRVLALLTSAPFGAHVGTAGGGVVDVEMRLEPVLPKSVTVVARPGRYLRHSASP